MNKRAAVKATKKVWWVLFSWILIGVAVIAGVTHFGEWVLQWIAAGLLSAFLLFLIISFWYWEYKCEKRKELK